MIRVLVLGVLFRLIAFPQSPPELCAFYQDQIKLLEAQPKGSARDTIIDSLLRPDEHPACIALSLGEPQQKAFTRALEAARTDEQTGAPAAAGGGTSLVSKGAAAKALSIAEEYGALTESVSKQVVTVSGSLDGIPGALIRGGILPYCLQGLPKDTQKNCIQPRALNLMRRLSYSISFDTTRANQTVTGTPVTSSATTGSTGSSSSGSSSAVPVTFNASGRQISAITAKFAIWNQRDAAYAKNWLKAIGDPKNGKPLSKSANDLLTSFEQLFPPDYRSNPQLVLWQKKAIPILENATDVQQAWRGLLAELLAILRQLPNLGPNVQKFINQLSTFDLEQDSLIATAANSPVLVFEYDNDRPVGQDSNSNFRVIFDKGFGSNWSITANAGADIWDHNQSNAGVVVSRLRDIQAGAEIDYKLGKLSKLLNAASLDGAYYFQYQNSPILLNVDASEPLSGISFSGLPTGATAVLAKTGDIHIGQLKLVLGSGSSVRVPLAISYSNRSELVPKPNWKAQIGISYDFDSLFSK